MNKIIFSVIAFTCFLYANCSCKCINGRVEALCDNSYEIKPICQASICPLSAPSIAPMSPSTLPPIGTTQCDMEQVFDDYQGRYVWKEICR